MTQLGIQVWLDERIPKVLQNMTGAMKLPGGGVVKAGSRAFRAGDLLAFKIDATGIELLVCKHTLVRAGRTNATIQVQDAHPFVVGDVISVGSDTAKTITAIDYEANEITVSGAAFAHAANENVVTSGTGNANRDKAVGIAGVPLMTRESRRPAAGNAGLVTPPVDTVYGDMYLTGIFYASVLQNGHFLDHTTSSVQTDLGGRYQADNDSYIITQVPSTYSN